MATDRRKDSKGRVLKDGECQRKDGTYCYRWTDKCGKRRYIYSKDLKTLRERKELLQKDIDNNINFDNRKMTLNQLFDNFIEYKTNNIQDSTIKSYRSMWENNIKNSIGNVKVCDLQPTLFEELYKKLDSRLSSGSISDIHNLLYTVLERAVKNQLIPYNPVALADKPIKRKPKKKNVISEQELKDLLVFCDNSTTYNIYRPLIEIAFYTCMRAGELAGLRWQDVNLHERYISVNHQLKYEAYNGEPCKFHIRQTKTENADRNIPISENTRKAFLNLKQMYFAIGRNCTATIDGMTDFVFITRQGTPFPITSLDRIVYACVDAYNKENADNPLPHISMHCLRHSGCTHYAKMGMNPKTLQKIMGHSKISTTLDIYTTFDDEFTKNEFDNLMAAVND